MASKTSNTKEIELKAEIRELKDMFKGMMMHVTSLSKDMQTLKASQPDVVPTPKTPPLDAGASHNDIPTMPVIHPKHPNPQAGSQREDSEGENSWYEDSKDDNESVKSSSTTSVRSARRPPRFPKAAMNKAQVEEFDAMMADLKATKKEMKEQLRQMAKGKNHKITHDFEKGLREA